MLFISNATRIDRIKNKERWYLITSAMFWILKARYESTWQWSNKQGIDVYFCDSKRPVKMLIHVTYHFVCMICMMSIHKQDKSFFILSNGSLMRWVSTNKASACYALSIVWDDMRTCIIVFFFPQNENRYQTSSYQHLSIKLTLLY